MEPNQESVSEPLKGRPPNQFETGEQPNIESSTPQDPNDILYIVLIGVGIGFALPYHRFGFIDFSIVLTFTLIYGYYIAYCLVFLWHQIIGSTDSTVIR